MKRQIIYGLLAGLIFAFNHVNSQDYSQPVIPLDSVILNRLDNGLNLMIVEDHQSPRVLTSLLHPERVDSFKTINSFINQILATGTTNSDLDSMKISLEKMGLSLRASPIGLQFFTTEKGAQNSIIKLAELLKNPDFNSTKLSYLKAEKPPEFSNESNLSITNRISDHILGFDRLQKELKLDSLQCARYFKELYQPENCLLIVVGSVTPDTIASLVKEQFAFWQTDSSLVFNRDILTQKDSTYIPRFLAHYTESTDPAYLKMLIPLQLKPAGKSAHYAEILNTILGGHPKSKLNEQLREKEGFSYGLLSRILRLPSGESYMTIQGGINKNQVDTAVYTILREIEDIRQNKVRTRALDLSKKIAITNYSRKLQRTENVVDMLYNQWYRGLPTTFHSSFIDSLDRINSVDLLEAANTILQPDSAIVIIVGNQGPLEDQLLHLSDTNLVLFNKYGEPVNPVVREIPDGITPQQIFKSYLYAVGSGMPADSIQSISTKWISQIDQAKVELKMRIKKPHHLLIEVYLDGEPVSITIFNRGKVWSKDLAGVSVSSDSSIVDQYIQQALIFPETKFDSSYVLKGIEVINGISAYRIESPSGNIYHYDVDNFFKIQTSLKGKNDQRITQFFSNYRRVKAIRYPHTAIVNGLAGWPLQFKLQEIEINPNLEDALFEIPEEKND